MKVWLRSIELVAGLATTFSEFNSMAVASKIDDLKGFQACRVITEASCVVMSGRRSAICFPVGNVQGYLT
jgi:hypothetical protein